MNSHNLIDSALAFVVYICGDEVSTKLYKCRVKIVRKYLEHTSLIYSVDKGYIYIQDPYSDIDTNHITIDVLRKLMPTIKSSISYNHLELLDRICDNLDLIKCLPQGKIRHQPKGEKILARHIY